MATIYLDNACTTFPKPPAVAEAISNYLTRIGSNINRSSYQLANKAEEIIFTTRAQLAALFAADDPRNIVFTKNITESLNVILKGFLKPGDHVIVSAMEHNAVMRPLTQLTAAGISFSRAACTTDGTLKIDELEKYLRKNTAAVVITHASNVCGTILPVAQIGDFCQKHNLKLIVDTAQTAGTVPINIKNMHIDALAFTGHKGLMGPQGIGGFILSPDMVQKIEPLIAGGTGSLSDSEETPSFMPDKFEAGTLNIPGIVGLNAALNWINDITPDVIQKKELTLCQQLLLGLKELADAELIKIIGKTDIDNRVAVVSIQALQQDNAIIASRLDDEFGIMTRVGLHCAPAAHHTLGTFPAGTIRFSPGWWNSNDDIECTITALKRLLK